MKTMTCGSHETEWVAISLDEYESMKATIETLTDEDAMEKILRGRKEITEGKFKTLKEIKAQFGL